jgi:hypothetical protein
MESLTPRISDMRSGRLSILQIRGVDNLRNINVTHNSYIYATMIFTASYVMFWMCADPLRGQLGGSWAPEIEAVQGVVGSRPDRDIISRVALVKDGDDLVARGRVK